MKHRSEIEPSLDPATVERLGVLVDLLLRWNGRINLVARGDKAVLWHRHILDSTQLAPLIPPLPGEVIDLGSGAGFPGLILAIMTGRHVHLVEADQRKCAFLREAVRATAAAATVHAHRAGTPGLPRCQVATARGLAPLAALLALAAPLLLPGGVAIFPKGQTAERELTAALGEWHMHIERFPSRTSSTATLLRLSEIRRAAAAA